MSSQSETVIGIVGGMGPEAGLMLFNNIMTYTNASRDQDHLPVILMSFPSNVVDRTEFLEGKHTLNPAYPVARIVQKLEAAGAGVVGIACNTMHTPRIFDVLLAELGRVHCGVQLLHMPLETCRYIRSVYPGLKRVGLLTTNGSYRYGTYKNIMERMGFDIVVPDADMQQNVIHRMIYDKQFGIKANPGVITARSAEWMEQSLYYFKKREVEAVVLGCTELPALLEGQKEAKGMAVVSSVEAMALGLIREATLQTLSPIEKYEQA